MKKKVKASSGSSPRAKLKRVKEGVFVRSSRKAGEPLSAESQARMAALARMPDSEIDFSDIPVLSYAGERPFIRNPFYHPTKKQVTLRLDADLLAWAKEGGAGYQTRINSILRAAFVRHRLNELKKKTEEFLTNKAVEHTSRNRSTSVPAEESPRMGRRAHLSSASHGQQQPAAAKRRS